MKESPDVDPEFLSDDSQLFELTDQGMYQPLDPEVYTFIGEWAEENKKPIDWLVEGAAKPRYFSPPPNFGDGSEATLFYFLIPDIQMMRSAVRALSTRAMWHLSHDRHAECWQDIRASYGVARHAQQSHYLISALVAVAVSSMADTTLYSLLQDEEAPDEVLQQIQKDLAALPKSRPMWEFLDEGERLGGLDVVTRMAAGSFNQGELQSMDMGALAVASRLRVDWNVVLEKTNSWYDRIVELSKLPHLEREEKLAVFQDDFEKMMAELDAGRMAQSIVSTRARSETVANVTLNFLLPALAPAMKAEDRFLAKNDMTKVAVALARHRQRTWRIPGLS